MGRYVVKKWNKWSKNRDRCSKNVTTNWQMKKSVQAVEDRSRQKSSMERSQVINNNHEKEHPREEEYNVVE